MKHEQSSRDKATIREARKGLQPIVKQGLQVQRFVLKASLMPQAQHDSKCSWVLSCGVT